MKKKFKYIDLFAGIGGMRIPFDELGGDCVFTSEFDKYAQQTYQANFNEIPFGDIKTIDSKEIPKHDLLLAGFPCQAFSHAGLKKGFDDIPINDGQQYRFCVSFSTLETVQLLE